MECILEVCTTRKSRLGCKIATIINTTTVKTIPSLRIKNWFLFGSMSVPIAFLCNKAKPKSNPVAKPPMWAKKLSTTGVSPIANAITRRPQVLASSHFLFVLFCNSDVATRIRPLVIQTKLQSFQLKVYYQY